MTEKREWYFFTSRATLWEVKPDDWMREGLIDFTFGGRPQEIARFRNDPYWRERFGDEEVTETDPDPEETPLSAEIDSGVEEDLPLSPYTIDDIIDEGCFLDRDNLQEMLSQFDTKQNLILQGPPGTGKTWLARKLAYALVGYEDDSRVWPIQFHPNMSYEDFVRGWRPSSNGLQLVDGPFLRLVREAGDAPKNRYVMVIEEINRGNPAQILGEILTLLEPNKRRAEEAMSLAYPRTSSERVHIPPNVFVIGTMNVADRSLALVDFALRRRFAFFDLEPTFGSTWQSWMRVQFELDDGFLSDIERRVTQLNRQIAADRNLGPQFRVGHSYFSPAPHTAIDDPEDWFRGVVKHEIGPLLDEYWFDEPDIAATAMEELLSGL